MNKSQPTNPRQTDTRPIDAEQMNAGQTKSRPANAGQINAGKVHKRAFDMDAAAKAVKAAGVANVTKSMAGAARDLDSAGAESMAGAESSLDSSARKSSKNPLESKSRTPHKSQSHKSQIPHKSSDSRATSPKHASQTAPNPRQNNSAQGIQIGIISALEIARFSDHGAYLIMPKAQNIAESKILNADFLGASVLDSGKKDSSANARTAKTHTPESSSPKFRVILKNAIPNFASHQIAEVLLPQKFCTPQMQVGDIVRAFVYTDSLDRPVATTQTPFATLGELAFLRVVSVASNGLFLDLGIDKDIFMPSKNAQRYALESTLPESTSLDSSAESTPKNAPKIAVYISLDKSGRLIAKRGIKEALAPYKIAHESKAQQRGKKVKILPYEVSPLGVSCVVEGRYYGLIYATDSKCAQNTSATRAKLAESSAKSNAESSAQHTPDIHRLGLEIGKEGVAFIQKVREDGRLDLTLRSASSAKSDAQKVLERLREAGGRLGVHYDSSPESINALFGISKKALKRALTELTKTQKITLIPQKEIVLNKT